MGLLDSYCPICFPGVGLNWLNITGWNSVTCGFFCISTYLGPVFDMNFFGLKFNKRRWMVWYLMRDFACRHLHRVATSRFHRKLRPSFSHACPTTKFPPKSSFSRRVRSPSPDLKSLLFPLPNSPHHPPSLASQRLLWRPPYLCPPLTLHPPCQRRSPL